VILSAPLVSVHKNHVNVNLSDNQLPRDLVFFGAWSSAEEETRQARLLATRVRWRRRWLIAGFAVAFVVTEPAQAPDGAPVLYEYHWTSDGGDQAIHSPKFDRTDVLVETELLDPGETWTIAVTPFDGGVGGTIYWAQAKIGDMSTGVVEWSFYP